jgi:CRP/FNR family transcriptional activator FtrB
MKSNRAIAMQSTEIDASKVRSVHLFRDLSDLHFHRLLKSASLRDIAPRTVLFREGDRPTVLFTLIKGSVELFSEHHEKWCTIAVIRPIKPCMLAPIVEGHNAMSARTLERSQFVLVSAKIIHEFIDSDPGFASAAAHELASDCNEVIGHFKNHRLRTTIERLAHWILRSDKSASGSGRFVMPCDKRILASYLGMAPESLSRNLAALCSEGLIVHGRRVTLNDRSALAAKAGLSLPDIR